VWIWIRDSKRKGVAEMEERMKEVARGAALMSRTQVEFEMENGLYEILVNETGAKALHKNMELVGPIT
jgi:aminobenzoyl-glutamate utilization protein B